MGIIALLLLASPMAALKAPEDELVKVRSGLENKKMPRKKTQKWMNFKKKSKSIVKLLTL